MPNTHFTGTPNLKMQGFLAGDIFKKTPQIR